MQTRQASLAAATPVNAAVRAPVVLRGRGLALARLGWLAAAVFILVLLAAAIPARVAELRTVCPAAPCAWMQLTPGDVAALRAHGLTMGAYVAYHLALTGILVAACLAVAAILVWRKPDEPMALLVALVLLILPSSAGPLNGTVNEILEALARAHRAWRGLVQVNEILRWLPLAYAFYLFPDGRFAPRWTRAMAGAWAVGTVLQAALPGSPVDDNTWPPPLPTLFFALVYGSLPLAQVQRYRRSADAVQRQQSKWAVLGFATAMLGFVGTGVLDQFLGLQGRPSAPATLAAVTVFYLSMTLIPLSLGVAILRYRLWDVDVLINRALVYAALTACVVSLYVLVVGGAGALFRAGGNLAVSLVATGVVAVLFQPLRERLQLGANRLLYGQRDEPYAVLSRLGQRLEGTLAPEAVLPAIVQTVAEALKLPYAAIALRRDGGTAIAAAHGSPVADPLRLPLTYQQDAVGELLLAPRAPGEAFSPADRRLLDDLARQAGVAAHAVRLTADLQRARERLVAAREEERRRLRRDLHDGLGPLLGSQALTIDAARKLVVDDPAAAVALLDALKAQSQTAVVDIRRLVYALRPPALDDLGLVPALGEQAAHYAHDGLAVTIEAPENLPPLPAAVEVAVYRIAQEALTNVSRHARARRCAVHLALDERAGALCLEVWDDGRGLPADRRAGVGTASMRERAEELGGTCAIESRPGEGTRVRARLPLVETDRRIDG